jgi:hypothetical protein
MKKTKPKNVNPAIPVHCAHTDLMIPREMKPNPLNPKRHGSKKLALYAKIIREGGWRRSIVVSKRSGLIVSGHGAWLAALNVLKDYAVPVDHQDFASAEAENAAMLADNWLAESLAEYDQDLSAEVVADLRAAGFDLELTGIIAAIDDNASDELKKMNIPPVPRMAWVLIGIPTVQFGRINGLVEKISRVEGVRIETAASSNGEENG